MKTNRGRRSWRLVLALLVPVAALVLTGCQSAEKTSECRFHKGTTSDELFRCGCVRATRAGAP